MKVRSKYVATPEDLPVTLDKGKKYFIESTGEIIIDFGHGPVKFGGGNEAPVVIFVK